MNNTKVELSNEELWIVDAIINAYIETYGKEKWNSLTSEEQHDVIMILAKDMLRSLNNDKNK